jgi:hypothetical protein
MLNMNGTVMVPSATREGVTVLRMVHCNSEYVTVMSPFANLQVA